MPLIYALENGHRMPAHSLPELRRKRFRQVKPETIVSSSRTGALETRTVVGHDFALARKACIHGSQDSESVAPLTLRTFIPTARN